MLFPLVLLYYERPKGKFPSAPEERRGRREAGGREAGERRREAGGRRRETGRRWACRAWGFLRRADSIPFSRELSRPRPRRQGACFTQPVFRTTQRRNPGCRSSPCGFSPPRAGGSLPFGDQNTSLLSVGCPTQMTGFTSTEGFPVTVGRAAIPRRVPKLALFHLHFDLPFVQRGELFYCDEIKFPILPS